MPDAVEIAHRLASFRLDVGVLVLGCEYPIQCDRHDPSSVLKALQDAQAALSRYIEPGGPGEADTINALLGILDNEALVRAQRAAGPQPIATAPREHEASLLLFCPEQGGWHVGQWWGVDRARWVAVVDHAIELEPTHWLPAPADLT